MELIKKELLTDVIEVFADKLGLDIEDIVPESNLRNDLGMDSLDGVEMILEFEKKYDITITDDEIAEVNTIQEYCELLSKLGV